MQNQNHLRAHAEAGLCKVEVPVGVLRVLKTRGMQWVSSHDLRIFHELGSFHIHVAGAPSAEGGG